MTGKAPGKFFRKGLSLIELFQMFPDDTTAERWFETQRWGSEGATSCPRCDSDRVNPTEDGKPMAYWCGGCRRHFSVRIGTVMQRSKISYQKWAIGIYLWATSLKGVSSMKLHRDLGLTQKAAYFMAQRLREALSGLTGIMAGPIEVDETFIGGLEGNKHASKKLHAGRGRVGKAIVVGAKDRDTNNISATVVTDTNTKTLHSFIAERVAEDAIIYTDDYKGYQNLPFEHETVKHSAGEYVNGEANTNGIESFWSMFKRGYHGTYHHLSEKHLHRYVNEFATRHNMRPMDTETMMHEIFTGMIGKRLTYKELIE